MKGDLSDLKNQRQQQPSAQQAGLGKAPNFNTSLMKNVFLMSLSYDERMHSSKILMLLS